MNPEVRQAQLSQLKAHVLKYSQPNDLTAWLMIGYSLLIEASAVILIHLQLGLLGWIIHTLNIVRISIQLHDMAHFSYFSSIRMNKFVGKLIGIYNHFPFNSWRDGHNHHHKHFGNINKLDLSQTILFTKKQYDQMKGVKKIIVRIVRDPFVYFFLVVPFFWFFGLYYVIIKRYGIFSTSMFEKTMSFILYSIIFPKVFGVPAFEMWVTMYFSTVLAIIIFHLEHSVNTPYRETKSKWDPVQAALQGSTYLIIPFFLKPFTNGSEYHHIHHFNTNVPSYRLADCHDDFDKTNKNENRWDKFHINRVSYSSSLSSMKNVMYDEEKQLLIPF